MEFSWPFSPHNDEEKEDGLKQLKKNTPVIPLSGGRSNVEDTGDRNVERNEVRQSEWPVPECCWKYVFNPTLCEVFVLFVAGFNLYRRVIDEDPF